ncbi:hypothetical protein [Antrihabitans cavernicola]|uniref:Uncharacterized protein n=1 Tax=Antrihabitans cavernicola TaxID=2495913 RepID=A0A5A7SAM8_9NOCA|nr:hypothetical protein [Spelaeibacter cavernicola]KAA0022544.1 hypothetical protein FOY51_12660 [Spelaeibacter cavernicola]
MLVRLFRGLSGLLTGGVIVLTLVVIGAAVVGHERNFPGPGAESIGWHVASAVVVLIVQRVADRRGGFVSFAASTLVIVVTGLLLWSQWWG